MPETLTPNDKYENFVNAYMEAVAEYILIKPRTKCIVPWETLAVRKKRKQHSYLIKKKQQMPTRRNLRKHKENFQTNIKKNKNKAFRVRSIKQKTR